jgi:hypothetical protein
MSKKQGKKLFFMHLQRWIKVYANQNSSYLFEFFSLISNPKVAQQLARFNIESIAAINSEVTHIGGIKDTLQLITDSFNGEFDNLVSIYMKLRANQLSYLGAVNVNRENKSKLVSLIKIEQYLIIVNSLFCCQRKRLTELAKLGLMQAEPLDKVYMSTVLHATVNFCESSFITKLAVQKLFETWGMNNLTNSQFKSALYHLIGFLRDLPIILFKNKPEHLKDFIAKIQEIRMQEYNDNYTLNSSSLLAPNFFTSQKALKRYI